MKINVGLVEAGEGHRTWRLPGLHIVDGKRQWRMGKLAKTQRDGSTRILGGVIKTDSTKERKAKRAAKADRAKRDQATLVAHAKSLSAPAKPAAKAKAQPAPSDVWGARPQPGAAPRAKRGQRACGQLTEEGAPCQRPWSAGGCGVDHASAAKAMKSRTKTASRGVPRSQAAAPTKRTPAKRSGGPRP